jgi:cysteine synthase
MTKLGLETRVTDPKVRERTVELFRERRIRLPTLSQLADPWTLSEETRRDLLEVDPDSPDPRNLLRVHWHNAADRRGLAEIPEHVVLTRELTGIDSPIVVVYGNRFPLISTHKVLAAYGCLVPRLITGQYDPTEHRAIWPSTGNYCRGGVAISRILGCRGVAILPEGMSEERFRWLNEWVQGPEDVIRTFGTESNVKEIYDKCAELENDPRNVIFNQFCEFGNHLVHYLCTGRALERVFRQVQRDRPELRLSAFVSATGSAGTIGAGDHLKDIFGTRIVAAEALECPTMLYNGFGEHNIQGIGDKHIPLVHNVMNTDVATAVSDRSTDSLNVLFNTEVGKEFLLESAGLSEELIGELENFGLSSLCNVIAAIKTAKRLQLGPEDAIVTVATDGAAMYRTEVTKALGKLFPGGFDTSAAARVFETELLGVSAEHILELSPVDRGRIFNLGYYTWVEQQGVSIEEFEQRRSQEYWVGLRELLPVWDQLIEEFNGDAGTG